MKWVKASEIKPVNANDVHWRWSDTKRPIKEKVTIGEFEASIPFSFPARGYKIVDLILIEWLDESTPDELTAAKARIAELEAGMKQVASEAWDACKNRMLAEILYGFEEANNYEKTKEQYLARFDGNEA